ncbi:hypothetical protein F5Y03DRAFT_18916 [Xylaria venustula]|nr:hypothetical protein F5Y03DRAFT_18916 [Xylaria venustula]
MADTIRGDGLFMAHNALATLVEDPQRLDCMRARFSEPPPSYQSHSSRTPSRSQSPNPPSEEQQRREWRQAQLTLEHPASLPSSQFDAQVGEECRWVYKERYPTHSPPPSWAPGPTFERPAVETVKKRWIKQGMWKDEWNNKNKPSGRWKHEEPLEPESESKTDSEAEAETESIFISKRRKSSARRRKGNEEIRQIAERRPVLEREREASRPYHQFLWQVSQERERIQDEQGVGGTPAEDLADVNTRAYERIKSRWMRWGVWHSKWGVLPGMWWKHERPLEELIAGDPVLAQANEPENHGHEATETPPRALPRGLFGGLSAGLQNSNGNPLSLSPRSQRLAQNRPESSRTVQRPLQSTKAIRDARPEAHAYLAPLNPSSVAKARKRAPALRRLRNASGEPSSSAPMPPRRSKRLQEAKLEAAQDTIGIAFTDSLKDKAPSMQRGIIAGKPKTASSAKPQGISKKPRLSTTQHRASRSN